MPIFVSQLYGFVFNILHRWGCVIAFWNAPVASSRITLDVCTRSDDNYSMWSISDLKCTNGDFRSSSEKLPSGTTGPWWVYRSPRIICVQEHRCKCVYACITKALPPFPLKYMYVNGDPPPPTTTTTKQSSKSSPWCAGAGIEMVLTWLAWGWLWWTCLCRSTLVWFLSIALTG